MDKKVLIFDSKEIAWAAGFFEGEGSVYVRPGHGSIVIQMQQVDIEPLCRFRRAFGMGRINGPYKHGTNSNRNPAYAFCIAGHEQVQAVMCLMWKYLSVRRKEQFASVFQKYRLIDRPGKAKKRSKTTGRFV